MCPALTLFLWTTIICSFQIAGHGVVKTVGVATDDVTRTSAVRDGEAWLACDTTPAQPGDALQLVVWYKDDVPVYSYDARETGALAHWSDAAWEGRAHWMSGRGSKLRIQPVLSSDRALYRCRADFNSTPTRNYNVMLNIIELPEQPKIFDNEGKELVRIAGPYREDTSLRLTCVVKGGIPKPRLRWWRDDKVLAAMDPANDASPVSSLELRILTLTRDHLDAVYSCSAENTNIVEPLKTKIQIQLYLRPLMVEILPREQPLSVGQETELRCRSIGSRPPALISWWLNGERVNADHVQTHSSDGNETIGRLRWTPRLKYDGGVLTCRASHPSLDISIETSMALSLYYAPIVTLRLDSKLNRNDIEEGDDVFLECIVRANPPAYKLVWEQNGQAIPHSQRAGPIEGPSQLTLRGVTSQHAGQYSCTAHNVEGDATSPPVMLKIIYKPVCKRIEVLVVGAALNEPTKVACEVNAYPAPNYFHWTFNNTATTVDIKQEKFSVGDDGRSVLEFRPTSDTDFGMLWCRASNLAGQQIEPCGFSILPATRPEPLTNCTHYNLTDDSVELRCTAGYNGGVESQYTCEAWDSSTITRNVTSTSPQWTLTGLRSGRVLRVLCYAHNFRGRSEVVTMRLRTASPSASYTEAVNSSNNTVDSSWALGVIAGAVGTLLFFAVVAAIARRRHHRPAQYEVPIQLVKTHKTNVISTNHSPSQPDPDVVPLDKDYTCQRSPVRPPEPPPYSAVMSPSVGMSASSHSLHREPRSKTPLSNCDGQVTRRLCEQRIVPSATLCGLREVVTTRTPLLPASAKESCV